MFRDPAARMAIYSYSRRFQSDMRLRTLPVFLAFLAMGFADAVGPFVSLAKNEFQLSNTVASLIPFVGFSMFGLLSIPMGVFQDKRGKKFVLMLGLVVALDRSAECRLRTHVLRALPADRAAGGRGRGHPAGLGQSHHAGRLG